MTELSPTPFDTSEAIVLDSKTQIRQAIMDDTASEEMIAEMRRAVSRRNKGIAVLIDENKSETAQKISSAFLELVNGVIDDEVIRRVQDNINTPTQFSDYVKSLSMLNKLVHEQMTTTEDAEVTHQRSKAKIQIAFAGGELALSVEDGNG